MLYVCSVVLCQVYKVREVKKKPEILKRLERTKEEKTPDLRALREERDREERARQRMQQQEQVNSISCHLCDGTSRCFTNYQQHPRRPVGEFVHCTQCKELMTNGSNPGFTLAPSLPPPPSLHLPPSTSLLPPPSLPPFLLSSLPPSLPPPPFLPP